MRRLYPELATTNKFDDLLNDPDLDAVVIATPLRFHYTMAKAALSVGKHVFIEKPIARTEAEAAELVSLAERQGLVLMVGHTVFVFTRGAPDERDHQRRGHRRRCSTSPPAGLTWDCFKKDINVAWDLAPHDISILLHLLG
jgi:predicted dehydrogenase